MDFAKFYQNLTIDLYIIITIIIFLVLYYLKNFLLKKFVSLVNSFFEKIFKLKIISKDDFLIYQILDNRELHRNIEHINNELYNLLLETNAEKIFIFLFHNGDSEKYSSDNLNFKISIINEKLKKGFRSDYKIMSKNIYYFWEIIKPLFLFLEKKDNKLKDGFYFYTFKNYTFLKVVKSEIIEHLDCEFLEDSGLEIIYLFPILNKTGNLFAILNIGYMNNKNINIEEYEELIEIIYEKINFLKNKLQQKEIKKYLLYLYENF